MDDSNNDQLKIDFGYERPLLSPLPIKKIYFAKGSRGYRLQKEGIETAERFISNLAEDLFEIQSLQGKDREIELQKFHMGLLENLINTSIYKSILPPANFRKFKEEVIRINSLC